MWEPLIPGLDRVELARPRIPAVPSQSVCLTARLCTADARIPEEPDAGKLHVRDGMRGAG
jgi:hypothetical protein